MTEYTISQEVYIEDMPQNYTDAMIERGRAAVGEKIYSTLLRNNDRIFVVRVDEQLVRDGRNYRITADLRMVKDIHVGIGYQPAQMSIKPPDALAFWKKIVNFFGGSK